MTMNWKRNSKKYIAGILTIALAVGAGQSYGSMEVSAQERTLPGIEKLVQDTVASSDGTFHILEIVPSKENATIGYLAGGEEPVSEGRKLSEMPSQSARQLWTVWMLQSFRRQVRLLFLPTAKAPELPEPRT